MRQRAWHAGPQGVRRNRRGRLSCRRHAVTHVARYAGCSRRGRTPQPARVGRDHARHISSRLHAGRTDALAVGRPVVEAAMRRRMTTCGHDSPRRGGAPEEAGPRIASHDPATIAALHRFGWVNGAGHDASSRSTRTIHAALLAFVQQGEHEAKVRAGLSPTHASMGVRACKRRQRRPLHP